MIEIIGHDGTRRDEQWLAETYGVEIKRAWGVGGPGGMPPEISYRVVRLIEREGAATQIVRVFNKSGEPVTGMDVARHWPTAPELQFTPATMWKSRAVIGATNADGHAGFGMGGGDYIKHGPGSGASGVWVASREIRSDYVGKLGMLMFTNHRHLDVVFQLQGREADEEPVPDDELQRAHELLTGAQSDLANAGRRLDEAKRILLEAM